MSDFRKVPPQRPDQRQYQFQTPSQDNISRTRNFSMMILKGVVGLIFLVAGLKSISTEPVYFVVYLIIGVALIAWGVKPYLEEQHRKKAEETEAVLNSRVPGLDEEDEAERLAKKYDGR